jgi:circadian clock protein KaiC
MTRSTASNGRVSKLRTGITGFDEISAGGLPEGRTTLIAGSAGSAKTLFAIQFLFRGIEDFEENGVFVTFEEPPADVTRNVRSLGWDLDKQVAKGRLAFVDASPDPGPDNLTIGRYDFSALLARIENAVAKVGAKRVSIDSVSSMFTQFEDAALVRRELFRLAAGLKAMGVTSLITAERLQEYGEIARYGVEEFVADNVVILRNTLDEERRRRTVEILKYRGTVHQNGEYPFTVSAKGIEVLPLSSMELTQRSSNDRVSSGNSKLDEMCGGGYYRDSTILVNGATGTGKTLMVTTFLNEGSKRGEKVLLFAFEESREQLLRNAIGWGMDFCKWEEDGLLKVVCTYPETMSPEDHLLKVKAEIERFRPSRVAIDGLSAMERGVTSKSFREFVIALTSHIKTKQITGLFTATTALLMGGGAITETEISSITDTIILLRYVEILGEIRRGMTVLKMRGSAHDKSIREYHIDGKGVHIGEAFRDVAGIMTGTPTRHALAEEERMGKMFHDVAPQLELAAGSQ